jgi:hypothetical protein
MCKTPTLLTKPLTRRQTARIVHHQFMFDCSLNVGVERMSKTRNGETKMLKKLAAIGLGAALILAPVASMAQTSTDTAPAAAPADQGAPAAAPKKHKMKKHTTKKHMAKKPAATPAPAATDAPKS